eukprot:6410030-Amphidinium_carterae.1
MCASILALSPALGSGLDMQSVCSNGVGACARGGNGRPRLLLQSLNCAPCLLLLSGAFGQGIVSVGFCI